MTLMTVTPGIAYNFVFENYKGERSSRNVIARSLQYGTTAWHKDLQFFLEAFDLDKQEVRQFPLNSIEINTFRRFTDEELDVLLTYKVTEAVNNVRAELETAQLTEALKVEPYGH